MGLVGGVGEVDFEGKSGVDASGFAVVVCVGLGEVFGKLAAGYSVVSAAGAGADDNADVLERCVDG